MGNGGYGLDALISLFWAGLALLAVGGLVISLRPEPRWQVEADRKPHSPGSVADGSRARPDPGWE